MTETWDGPACPAVAPAAVAAGLRQGVLQMTERGTEKWCPRCEEYWPADTVFWHRAKDKRIGLQTYCRACMSERRPRYNQPKAEVRHAG